AEYGVLTPRRRSAVSVVIGALHVALVARRTESLQVAKAIPSEYTPLGAEVVVDPDIEFIRLVPVGYGRDVRARNGDQRRRRRRGEIRIGQDARRDAAPPAPGNDVARERRPGEGIDRYDPKGRRKAGGDVGEIACLQVQRWHGALIGHAIALAL